MMMVVQHMNILKTIELHTRVCVCVYVCVCGWAVQHAES